MKTLVTATAIALMGTSVFANEAATDVRVFDHVKTVTTNIPVTTTECQNVQVPIYGQVQQQGNAVEGAIGGAIIGGIIGNNVGNIENGGALGAVIGMMLGHNKTNKTACIQRKCKTELRWKEEQRTVYSHSHITFWYEGKKYTLQTENRYLWIEYTVMM